jgi:ribosomal protein S13
LDQLKKRTIIALNKLGHQKFSTESGGYSLENWTRGVNLLLDEFEKKVSAARLPSEYFERRRELAALPSKTVDLSQTDNAISDLKRDEAEIRRKIDESRTGIAFRVKELEDETAKCSTELEEKQRLSVLSVSEQDSKSLFRRIFGRNSKTSTKVPTYNTAEVEERIKTLTNEALEQQRILTSIDHHSAESPLREEWEKLESLQAKMKELEGTRLEKLQQVREREELTASIARAISSISAADDRAKGEANPSS